MNKIKKRVRIGFLIGIAILILFPVWYVNHYSMDIAPKQLIKTTDLDTKVLIATQGSIYKNRLTNLIIKKLEKDSVFIKVIDVSDLASEEEEKWNAIVLIHTWEMWKPPIPIKNFIDQSKNPNKLIVHTTSGGGFYHMDEVDAITGASIMKDIPNISELIIQKINVALLTNQKISKINE